MYIFRLGAVRPVKSPIEVQDVLSLFADLAPLCLREANELPILLDRAGRALGVVHLVWSSTVDALFPRLGAVVCGVVRSAAVLASWVLDAVSAVVIVLAVIALYYRVGPFLLKIGCS
jgi:hypothetical protein